MNSCVFTPTVKVKGEELVSKLWNEILQYTNGDTVSAKVMYAGLTGDKIKLVEGLEYNDLGEVTLESAKAALPLDLFLNKDAKLKDVKRLLGAIDSKGNFIYYTYTGNIADLIETFNKKNKDYVATIKTVGRTSTINVDFAADDVEYIKSDYSFKNKICKDILAFLESKGFGLSFLAEGVPYAGLFSPDAILNTELGLRDIISIAKGERGEKALVEEFGHLLIYGLNHTPIVKRLIDNLLTPIDGKYLAIQDILGDLYEKYVKEYTENNVTDYTRLAYEAAGKLLFELLQLNLVKNTYLVRSLFGEEQSSDELVEGRDNVVTRFAKRIWNAAKSILKNISPSDLTTIVNDARVYAGYIASEFQHNKEGLSKYIVEKNFVNAKTLYDVDDKINLLYKQALTGVNLIKRKMRLDGYNKLVEHYGDETVNKWYAEIKASLEALDKGNAELAISTVLSTITDQIKNFDFRLNFLKSIIQKDPNNYGNITKMATFLNELKISLLGFDKYIRACRTLDDLISEDDVKPSEAFIENVKEAATNIDSIMSLMSNFYQKNARQVLKAFLAPHFKEYTVDMGKGKVVKVTLDMILDYAELDSNIIDRYIRGMSRSRDPLLNIANAIAEEEIHKVNMDMVLIESMVRNLTAELEASGIDNSFIYERNEDGKLTGRIISEYNWDRWEKDLDDFKRSLTHKGIRGQEYYSNIKSWMDTHSKEIVVGATKTYTVPNLDYEENGVNIYKKPLILDAEQRKYYEAYLLLKAAADSLLGDTDKPLNLFNAVLKRRDSYQSKKDKLTTGSLRETGRLIKEDYLNEYKTLVDDLEYRHRSGLTDFSGRPLKEVPMFYVDLLEDVNLLMTDSASAILAYYHMASNYNSMKKLLQNFLLLLDWVENYRETDTGEVKERQPDGTYTVERTKAVLSNSNTAAILDNFILTNLLQNKKDIETFSIGKWRLNIGKVADKILRWNSLARISSNLRVDLGNRVSALFNQLFEAIGGLYYTYDLFFNAEKKFWKLLPAYSMNSINATQNDFLSLLIKKYDIMEAYESDVENAGIRWGKVSRAVGNATWYLGLRIGEIANHVPSAIAMLSNTKVLDEEGKETNLFDTLLVVEFKDENGYTTFDILPRKGVKDLDGHLLREGNHGTQFLTILNVDATNKIHSVNQTINGAFRTINRGAMNRKWVGRAAIQFRQWMVDYFDSRWGGGYYDARLKEYKQSTYRGGFKAIIKSINDSWKHQSIKEAFKLTNLNDKEKYLVKKMYAEAAAFVLTGLLAKLLLTMFTDEDPDKKHRWKTKDGKLADNMFMSPEAFAYGICRLWLMQTFVSHRDLGAEFPNPGVFDNFNSIFKNLFPSLEAFSDFLNVLNPWLLNDVIDHKNDPLGFLEFDNKYLYNLEIILWPQLRTWNKTLRIVADDSMLDYQQYLNAENIFY